MGNCLCFGRGNTELEDDLLSRDESNYSVNSFSQDALNNSQGNARYADAPILAAAILPTHRNRDTPTASLFCDEHEIEGQCVT